MTSAGKVKIGIIGLGNMGSIHVRHVTDLGNTELAAICDIDEAMRKRITDEYEVDAYIDYIDMLDHADLDGIIIATPHYSHPDMTLAAFDRGIHVLVEKPIAVHVNDAKRMIDGYAAALEKHPNLVFEAMFMQRTWGHWKKIKSMIDNGDLGQLIRTTWLITDWFRTQSYYDSGGWRATWEFEGGGVLINQCPHNLDLYQWMVGIPSKIHGFATFGKHHNIEVADEVTGYFEHENGMVGHFITTTGESPGTNRLEIVGDKGKLVYEQDEIVFYKNEWSSIKQLQESPKGFEKVPVTKEIIEFDHNKTNSHELVIENFADVILNDIPLIAPAGEGINSVMIQNAIILSSHKKETVTLPIDGDEYWALIQHYIEEAKQSAV